MPYGAQGGDTPAKDRKIETRVNQIKAKNPRMPKSEQVAIAKVQTGNGKPHGGSPHSPKTPHDHLHAAHAAMKGRKR